MLIQTQTIQPPPKSHAVSPVNPRKIEHPTWTECQATLPLSAATNACGLKLDPFFNGGHTAFLDVHAFGDRERLASMHSELQAGGIEAPETALLQKTGVPGGIQVATISGIASTPLFGKNGRIIGRFFEDSDAKYCVLGDVRPTNPQASRGAQTTDVLDAIQRALTDAGMHFRNVVRTWFYNDEILDWYAEFNQARTAFFQQQGITLMPASTGIGVSNAEGAALVAKAIAVQPKTRAVTVRRVDSPLQREPSTYGSSFSRAMEVADPAGRILYISGTASIFPNGETAHTGNVAAQIEKTMEVVGAILTNNGMSFSDSTRAIAYFRHEEDIPLWEQYCRTRQLPPLPVILTQCDVCRDNLLFEIELDAAKKTDRP
jgi:enamine deaminase RidA (YjgF/YER057c/UK114 family)